MKKDRSHIAFVLDRSGSMQTIWSDAEGGFKQFLTAQKKEPGEALLTLAVFDDQYDVVVDAQPITEVSEDVLTKHKIAPRGNTALNDALGRTISALGAKLAAMPEEERPEHVVIAVMTDGHENASREYTKKVVKEMTEHQTEVYKWTFMFLGADVNAFDEAVALGIRGVNSINWTKSASGLKCCSSALSDNVSRVRRGSSGEFTDSEKEANKLKDVLADVNKLADSKAGSKKPKRRSI